MAKKNFDEYQVNELAKTPERTITETDLVNFAGVSGDFHELHTNKSLMEHGKYGERLIHGLLVYSIARGLIFRLEDQPETIAFYGIDRMRFVNPVFIDDTIHVKEEVVTKEEKGAESGVIQFKDEIINQQEQTVLVAYPKLLVARGKTPTGS